MSDRSDDVTTIELTGLDSSTNRTLVLVRLPPRGGRARMAFVPVRELAQDAQERNELIARLIAQ
jgi:hypothetical protein